ncbi:MAG: translesion error-prone DNA polymerase V autoproteolytic subunit [Bacteroidales bacterium]|nr:translesion error-prone DNA polymerase V autoproteolytic subunit [Bacteroidales bacterium]
MKKITDYFNVFQPEIQKKYKAPLVLNNIQAGFPSPAEDHIDLKLDLNEHLVSHPAATFYVRATGDSMIDAGINEGDLLIVDRAKEAKHNDIVVAVLFGDFTLKRFIVQGEKFFLKPENQKYKVTEITDESDFAVWGVVTYVIAKK